MDNKAQKHASCVQRDRWKKCQSQLAEDLQKLVEQRPVPDGRGICWLTRLAVFTITWFSLPGWLWMSRGYALNVNDNFSSSLPLMNLWFFKFRQAEEQSRTRLRQHFFPCPRTHRLSFVWTKRQIIAMRVPVEQHIFDTKTSKTTS